MRVWTCGRCGQLVFFHNDRCVRCDALLAYDPRQRAIVVLDDPSQRCVNAEVAGCNWTAPAPGEPCVSCRLTRTRPADDDPVGLQAYAEAEVEKRRLVDDLLTLGIHLEPHDEEAGTGVAFDLLSSVDEPVTTGHAGGIITLDLAEVDDVHRMQLRAELGEDYRTVLGHFRHEIGHHLFPVLVGEDDLAEVRAAFGDETADYQAALDRHYENGPPEGWESEHVSAYATMHPAEDWAETFAHYLHIRATLETAATYRLRIDGPSGVPIEGYASDPAAADTSQLDAIVEAWLPLSYALNAIGRNLGEGDLYPFVLTPAVLAKLGIVHRLVQRASQPGG